MTGDVADADEGAPVLDTEGNQVGVVADVRGDEVLVDPVPDVTDDARAALGWQADPEETRSIPRGSLEREPPDADPADASFRLNLRALNR